MSPSVWAWPRVAVFDPLAHRRSSRPSCRRSSSAAPLWRACRVGARCATPRVISVARYCFVCSCATIVAPALPSASFEPVCSGCQSVLNSVFTGRPPVSWLTCASSAADRDSCPPLTSRALSGPTATTTLPPAPDTTASMGDSRVTSSVGATPAGVHETCKGKVEGACACARRRGADAASTAPPRATRQKSRREATRGVRPAAFDGRGMGESLAPIRSLFQMGSARRCRSCSAVSGMFSALLNVQRDCRGQGDQAQRSSAHGTF